MTTKTKREVKLLADLTAIQEYDDLNKIDYVNILSPFGIIIMRVNGKLSKSFGRDSIDDIDGNLIALL